MGNDRFGYGVNWRKVVESVEVVVLVVLAALIQRG